MKTEHYILVLNPHYVWVFCINILILIAVLFTSSSRMVE